MNEPHFYKVTDIISCKRILVDPAWKMIKESGNIVTIDGIDTSGCSNGMLVIIKDRLKKLLIGHLVELKIYETKTANCVRDDGSLKCMVYLNSVDVSKYFPEAKK